MTVTIVSIDSNGTEREVGTASSLDFEYETFPDPELGKYPFMVATPRIKEHRVVLHDFSGRPDPSLYGGIYRELRTENSDLREQLEQAEANFEHNLEQVREKYQAKLSNQQKNFEDFTVGQANARHIRKEGEKALKVNATLTRELADMNEQIETLEGRLVAAQNSSNYWYAEWSALQARIDEGGHAIDSSVVQEYEERIERLTTQVDVESERRERWMDWHEEDTRALADQRNTLQEQLHEAQDAIAKLLDGFNEGFEAMDAAASEWNAFATSEVPA